MDVAAVRTCTAPVNIAVVKYWGKRDEKLVLPINSSVSVTLSQYELRAKTSVAACKTFEKDRLWLNGREERVDTARIQNLLNEGPSENQLLRSIEDCFKQSSILFMKLIPKVKQRAESQGSVSKEMLNYKLHICSENNFPTAAGLASSAAGYACLAYTLAKLYKIKGVISDIARRGSGSACRSVYGGFVVWEKGEEADGSDSIAWQLAPESHWPELRVLILVVSDQKKHIGSSEGMQTTVRTSELVQQRIRCVPERVTRIKEAILKKDFETFAGETMKDSNQLHAVCLDTYPPISYQTDISRQIMGLVHAYNKHYDKVKVAYTFDAGPNACLYLLEKDVPEILSLVTHFFPPSNGVEEFVTGMSSINQTYIDKGLLDSISIPIQQDSIKYIIYTKPGAGPQECSKPSDCLLDENGLPVITNGTKRKHLTDKHSIDDLKTSLESPTKKVVKTDVT